METRSFAYREDLIELVAQVKTAERALKLARAELEERKRELVSVLIENQLEHFVEPNIEYLEGALS